MAPHPGGNRTGRRGVELSVRARPLERKAGGHSAEPDGPEPRLYGTTFETGGVAMLVTLAVVGVIVLVGGVAGLLIVRLQRAQGAAQARAAGASHTSFWGGGGDDGGSGGGGCGGGDGGGSSSSGGGGGDGGGGC